ALLGGRYRTGAGHARGRTVSGLPGPPPCPSGGHRGTQAGRLAQGTVPFRRFHPPGPPPAWQPCPATSPAALAPSPRAPLPFVPLDRRGRLGAGLAGVRPEPAAQSRRQGAPTG